MEKFYCEVYSNGYSSFFIINADKKPKYDDIVAIAVRENRVGHPDDVEDAKVITEQEYMTAMEGDK